ncbi:MAG TPA: S-layer homology domain-containing protein, partial [Vicinamibacterales bacterium]|nr:S-layer homology domain-containing protein [Vicinamibacterales bacterium]
AREASRAGRLDEALKAYNDAIQASPDSAFLYVEAAAIERRKGDTDAAIDHLRKAVALDAGDFRSLTQIGEMLEAKSDVPGAIKAYSDAVAIEPNPDLDKRIADLKENLTAPLPEAYRAIADSPQITRADLATLIAVRLERLVPATRAQDDNPLTDVAPNSKAILLVVRGGIMDAYPNHTFAPRSAVSRADLAQVASRLLARIAAQHPDQRPAWESAKLTFSDLPAEHIAYGAASAAVAAGVMTTDAGNAFQPLRTVSGAEAAKAVAKIESIAGRSASGRLQ